MTPAAKSRIPEILVAHEKEILGEWMERQLKATTLRADLLDQRELRAQSTRFLALLREAAGTGDLDDVEAAPWAPVREFLDGMSRERARQGFSPVDTATFVFSLKEPLFVRLTRDIAGDPTAVASELWRVTTLIDSLGLYTTQVHQKGREEVIMRQQQELLELSTPVVELWEGVLGLPLIGTLDSSRTQVVMENLLQRLVETGATMAIIDITGVPTVDTLVAQHLLKTIAAARLMGADCIISGIRPQIAQTIVHLGVDLSGVITKATLADAFRIALQRTGFTLSRPRPA
jgi:rsbT co-antagonist protein RsbR